MQCHLYEMFEQVLADSKDKIAIQHNSKDLTYIELDQKVTQIMSGLSAYSFDVGANVGILLEPSSDRIALILAILKMGNIFMPLPAHLSSGELTQLAEYANIQYIIHSESFPKTATLNNCIFINIQDVLKVEPVILNEETYFLRRMAVGDTLYLIRTSGTTGNPKIVKGSHKGTLNRINWSSTRFPFRHDDVCCHKTPLTFVDSIVEIFSPLLNGIPLVIFDTRESPDLLEWGLSISQNKITRLTLVPSLLEAILEDHPEVQALFNSVQIWFCSGEELRLAVAVKFKEIFPKARLINIYGSTEVSADCSFFEVKNEKMLRYNLVPIGNAIDNTEIIILKDEGLGAEVDEIGEILVSGSCLANGYFKNDQLNEERFVRINNKHYFRTNDLGFLGGDNLLYYQGRVDDRITVAGEKYYLNEIRQSIQSLQDIRLRDLYILSSTDVAALVHVVIVSDQKYKKKNRELITGAIKSDYGNKIQVQIHFSKKIPLNASGKVDKNALFKQIQITMNKVFKDKNSKSDSKLKVLWRESLKVSEIKSTHNFFALGGSSITAIKLISSIRQALNIEVSIRTLYHYPGFREFQEQVMKMRPIENLISNPWHHETDNLTIGQNHIISSALISQNPAIFNVVISLTINIEVCLERFIRSLDAVWQEYPGLRTVFFKKEGVYYQSILDSKKFPLEEITTEGTAEGINPLTHLIHKAKSITFDFIKGPLVRGFLYSAHKSLHNCVLVFHHSIIDDHSIDVFLRALSRFYKDDANRPEKAGLNLLQIAYVQQQDKSSIKFKDSLYFWAQQLENIEKVVLPVDRMPGSIIRNQGHSIPILIGDDHHKKLLLLAKNYHTTGIVVLTTVFCWLLHFYSRQDKLPINMPITSRDLQNDDEIIGNLTNFIIAVIRIAETESFEKNLLRARSSLLEAMEHRNVPITDILTQLNQIRSLSVSPFFNVMVIAQSDHQASLVLNGKRMKVREENIIGANTELSLIITESDGISNCMLEYDSDLFNHSTIQVLVSQFTYLLDGALSEPQKCLTSFYGKILKHYRGKGSNIVEPFIDIESSVGDVFRESVRKHHDKVAVIHNQRCYRYSEIEKMSNQVAHFLIDHGVQINDLIGVNCCRSPTLIIIVLGILKAGGCFILLDPTIEKNLKCQQVQSYELKYLFADMASFHAHLKKLMKTIIFTLDLDYYSKYKKDPSNRVVRPESRCYCVPTSGTTGAPKLAINHHRGMLYHIHEKIMALDLATEFNFLQTASVQSDIVIWQLLAPLLMGGTVNIIDNALDFSRLLDECHRNNITVLQFVPSVIDLLTDYLLINVECQFKLGSLRWLISIGETLSPKTANTWLSIYPHVPIVNAYGPAECADTISLEIIRKPVPMKSKISLGVLFPATKITILDAYNQVMPHNSIGQIGISGPGVGYGYHLDEKKTSEKFIFSLDNPEETIYLTGDIGKIDQEGKLYFFGREDQQYKRYGYRFNLNDINQILLTNPDVKSAFCVIIENKIVLFYVLKIHNCLSYLEINDFLRSNLPIYAIPDNYKEMDCFSYLSSGKVDSHNLARFYLKTCKNRETSFDCYNLSESRIIDLLKEALKVEGIAQDDNFFTLGGNSLDALKFCNTLAQTLGINIGLKEILLSSTIRELLRTILVAKSRNI